MVATPTRGRRGLTSADDETVRTNALGRIVATHGSRGQAPSQDRSRRSGPAPEEIQETHSNVMSSDAQREPSSRGTTQYITPREPGMHRVPQQSTVRPRRPESSHGSAGSSISNRSSSSHQATAIQLTNAARGRTLAAGSQASEIRPAAVVDRHPRDALSSGSLRPQQSTHSPKSYGMEMLHRPQNGEPYVDIIFIHGWNGNRTGTWTSKKNNILWPRDLLREQMPQARILTWGYDADFAKLLGGVGQNSVRDHANNLLTDVANIRSGNAEVCLPSPSNRFLQLMIIPRMGVASSSCSTA